MVWGTGGPEFKSRRSDQQPLCSSSDFASAESAAANRKENIAAQISRKRRAKSRTESRTVRKSFRRWYPIECQHGYDCCPICDGPRRDTITLRPARPEGGR
jgi:hypothetical protein